MTNCLLLIIDDDEAIRDSCSQALGRNRGYAVTAAVDGKSGLDLVRKLKPDLALVDLKLPGMGGIEIIREIRKIDPHIVTIIVTGYPTVISAVEAMKNGAYDFLPKPFTPDELRIIVKRGLDKRRLELETMALRKEREAMQRHFVSLVSHELRAPLISVQQYIDAILTGAAGQVVPEQEKIFKRISARVEGLMSLIDKWLSLNRMKSGKLGADLKPWPFAPILREAVDILRPMASAKGVSLTADLPPDDAAIVGDRECLRELLLNLVGNAIKYNRERGSVQVRAALQDGKEWRIEVRDTGRGIPEEDLPHIFDEFYRGENGRDPASGGSGLGLAIVNQIVQLHRGSIDVSSRVGEGSVFTVVLPAVPEPPSQGGHRNGT